MITHQYLILKKMFATEDKLIRIPWPISTHEIQGYDYEGFQTFEEYVQYQDGDMHLQEVAVNNKLHPDTIQYIKNIWSDYSNKMFNKIVLFPRELL